MDCSGPLSLRDNVTRVLSHWGARVRRSWDPGLKKKPGFVGRHFSNLRGLAQTPKGGESHLPAQCKLGRPWQVPFVLSHGLPRKLAARRLGLSPGLGAAGTA
jgi:hypothetical protein